MKAILTRTVVTLGLALGLGFADRALGDTPGDNRKVATMKGMATSVDPTEKSVWVKEFWGARRLNVANDCKVSLQDKPNASLGDLRPGQMLEVRYENAEGVLVAHEIAQQDLSFSGVINAIDAAKHTVTLRDHALKRTFQIGDDCRIVLRNEKSGTLSDLQPGHHVTVTYEIPNGSVTARQIAQTSATYSGALTAIDLNNRTVKAKGFLSSMKFNLADDCMVMVNGKPAAKLSDLKLGDKIVFSYDDVKGINIANRIATTDPTPEPPATVSQQSSDSGQSTIPDR